MDKKPMLAGVIGNPIHHSRSPVLFQKWFQIHHVKGYYIPMHVETSNLAAVLKNLPKLGCCGINVTLPHKQAVLHFASTISPAAQAIGAANTLTFDANGDFHADNTDAIGFMQNIIAHAPHWQPTNAPVVIFGAGGATRAVLYAVLNKGATNVRLINRTRAKAEALARDFASTISIYDWDNSSNALAGAGTVINTTALGMAGQNDLLVDFSQCAANAVVSDLVYTPLATGFLKKAKAAGCQIVDGLGMLLYQAVPGFERWFGHTPSVTNALRQHVLSQ